MTKSDPRFAKLERRVNSIEEGLATADAGHANPPIMKAPWTNWPLVGAVATLIACVVGATTHIDSEVSAIRSDISGLRTRAEKVEGAIKVLNSQQTDQTQKLIRDLLAAAATAKAIPTAEKTIEVASNLTTTLRDGKRPAPPEFFMQASDVIDEIGPKRPELSQELYHLRTNLAAYRSAVNETVPLPNRVAEPIEVPQFPTLGFAVYPSMTTITLRKDVTISSDRGSWLDCRGMKPGQEMLKTTSSSLNDSGHPSVKGISFIGATQTLDGLYLQDVTFLDTHIRYQGGPVRLLRVRFIRCTFDFPATSNRGNGFTRYAAIEPDTEFTFGE